MPEGPELHLTCLFINRKCKDKIFSGKILRNPIHKCPEIDWDEPLYTISAESKGKEFMLHLNTVLDDMKRGKNKKSQKLHLESAPSLKKTLSIHFTFGMSGKFEFTPENECPKHSHLRFLTKSEPKMSLSFVDYRRFGKWFVGGQWSPDRGPCVIGEFESFVENIVNNIDNPSFNKPICEVLLNQKFFNGIGNYLRAEILYRCKVPPFEKASNILRLNEFKEEPTHIKAEIKNESEPEESKSLNQKPSGKKSTNKQSKAAKNEWKHSAESSSNDLKLEQNTSNQQDYKTKSLIIEKLTPQAQELLKLCHTVPTEVVNLGSTKYALADMYAEDQEDGSLSFITWLQCYYQPGMKNLVDHNKRTIWFSGPAGPLVPSSQKSRALCKAMKPSTPSVKREIDEEKQKPPKRKLKTKQKVVQENEVQAVKKSSKRQIKEKSSKNGQGSSRKTKKIDGRSNGKECDNKISHTKNSKVSVKAEKLVQTLTKRKRRAPENAVGEQNEELPKIRSSKRLKSHGKVL